MLMPLSTLNMFTCRCQFAITADLSFLRLRTVPEGKIPAAVIFSQPQSSMPIEIKMVMDTVPPVMTTTTETLEILDCCIASVPHWLFKWEAVSRRMRHRYGCL